MRFSKMHGAGNDFVVLDLRDGREPPSSTLCRRLADRRTGVGCDQILTIAPARAQGALARYAIVNADGSHAGQCGNGARCVAAWLRRDAQAAGRELPEHLELESPAGLHAVGFAPGGGVRLDMGAPDFSSAAVPLTGLATADEYRLDTSAGTVAFGAVSMGNPHAVIRVDSVEAAPVAALGPALQAHPAFPASVNVGVVEVVDRRHLRLRVHERGVGETLACGSGACAAAVVAMCRGWVDRAVEVALPGGILHVHWPADGAGVVLTGPATFVFEGDWIDD